MKFHKYQGTGNDFIMVDNREGAFPETDNMALSRICHRRFGIGADGIILLNAHPDYDFEMIYYNSDGNISTMCGNGGRCIARFAKDLEIVNGKCRFLAADGPHEAQITDEWVSLQMRDVKLATQKNNGHFIDTGSPHHVIIENNVQRLAVATLGRKFRNEIYGEEGANINFVHKSSNNLYVRTYERGVENETLSCGTGVTAVALVAFQLGEIVQKKVDVHTTGGMLHVSFEPTTEGFKNIWLSGPADFVFKGEIEL